MSTLTVELSPELLERLQAEANQRQEPPERTAVTLLEERLTPPAKPEESEREKVRRVLRETGLLSELSPGLRARIKQTVRHEDVVTALDRAGGKPLSEIILEQRGLKE